MNEDKDKVMTANGISLIAGLWLILSPFILGFSGGALSMSSVVVGILVAIAAIIRLAAPATTVWAGWLSGLFGLWTLISPFAVGEMMAAAVWSSVIVGLLVIVLTIWSLSSATMGHPKMG